jgi:hypothetical protein
MLILLAPAITDGDISPFNRNLTVGDERLLLPLLEETESIMVAMRRRTKILSLF